MTTGKGAMPLNIQADDDPTRSNVHANPRARPMFVRNIENDLNALTSVYSIEDNTRLPGYNPNIPVRNGTRRKGRRYTLSNIEKDLEEAKRCIEANIESKLNENHEANSKHPEGDNVCFRKSSRRTSGTSETEKKRLYTSEEDNHSGRDRSEKIYHRYVQEGERNLMLIYESKETKSEVYCKQIGNKNIIVHLNVNSNLCQLIDTANKGVIPLDSEGEVWLEIKRRSQVIKTSNECDMSSASLSDNNDFGTQSKHPSEPVRIPGLQASYTEGRVARNSPTEHFDTCYDNNVAGYHDDDINEDKNHYDTISVKERGDSLMIKVEKRFQHDVLNAEDIQKSPILSHKKVLDFLSDKGNNFDVSICDWEYEKESVYSYISSLQNDDPILMESPYTDVTRNIQHAQRELDENSIHGSCDEHHRQSHYVEVDELVDAKGRTNATEDLYTLPGYTKPRHQPIKPDYTECRHQPIKPDYTEPRHQTVESDKSCPPLPNRNHHGRYDVLRSQSLPNDPNMRVQRETLQNNDHRARGPTEDSDYCLPTLPLPPKPRSSDPANYSKGPPLIPNIPVSPNPEKPHEQVNYKKKKLIPPHPGIIDLETRIWYHGKLEKDVAKQRLKGKEHGSFLVRDAAGSSADVHQYTIEFIDENCVKKLMIMKTLNKYHFKEFENKKFDRVEQLIETIISSGLEVKDSATHKWKNIKVKPVPH